MYLLYFPTGMLYNHGARESREGQHSWVSCRIVPYVLLQQAASECTCLVRGHNTYQYSRCHTAEQSYFPSSVATAHHFCSSNHAYYSCSTPSWILTETQTTSLFNWLTFSSRCSCPPRRQKFFPLRKNTQLSNPWGVSGFSTPDHHNSLHLLW